MNAGLMAWSANLENAARLALWAFPEATVLTALPECLVTSVPLGTMVRLVRMVSLVPAVEMVHKVYEEHREPVVGLGRLVSKELSSL